MDDEERKVEKGVREVIRMDSAHRSLDPEEAKAIFKDAGVDMSGLDMGLVERFDVSDETKDRHGDTIAVSGWELKNYGGTFLWGHRQGDLPVGKASRTWKREGKLRQVVAFASKDLYPFGNTVGKMYKAGLLQDVSVGFNPIEFKRYTHNDPEVQRGERGAWDVDFIKQELLEVSAVNVGANPNAGKRSAFAEAKALGIDTASVAEMASRVLDEACKMAGIDREHFESLYFEHKNATPQVHDLSAPAANSVPTSFEEVQAPPRFTEAEKEALRQQTKELFQ